MEDMMGYDDLVKRLRYTHEHGIFDANIVGMLASPNEAADAITTLRAEIPSRDAALVKAREALEVATNTFADYAEMHSAKGTEEGHAKARRNVEKAEQMNAAIRALATQA
jgi:hypothetical protein